MAKDQALNRFSENTGTCYGKNYKSISYGFFSQFQDSFFYANVIQVIVVVFLYFHLGNGRYWNLLLIASISGFLGAVIENATVAYLCLDSQKDNKSHSLVIPFLIAETFWTTCQYSIPFLNLIKMRAFAKGKQANIIRSTIIGLFVPFLFFRFFIGYERMMKGYLVDDKISSIHGYAFGVLAISDFICTISIIYFVKKHNRELAYSTSNVSDYIKNSSYITLVAVDSVGFCLSILDIITNLGIAESFLPKTITVPFQCLMSNFVLILTVDALLFKYNGSSSSNVNNSNINNYPSKNTTITKNKNDESNSTISNNYFVSV
ncbi:hypothetical protein BCR32DRAFT_245590 [Anaeromyces robustus]|uniref:Uncharacterized protein n=1 Tax=Anaeromyces robustus TaxID=1754192 RepID=A0A1Y1X590_9FUNG|nr:hypothetical protein BCR32DRAFT_245590 [Anaeromyces robustus]|eukprot:ORX80526.1 hypothetical protein BCR32DRAFT_245590 [Anaeromyces robustus]